MEVVKANDVLVAARDESKRLFAQPLRERYLAFVIEENLERYFLLGPLHVASVVHDAVGAATNDRQDLVSPVEYLALCVAGKRHV